MLEAIRDFFGQSQLTVQKKEAQSLYFLEMANIKAMTLVVNHCVAYPLLGHKFYQLATVMKNSVALSHLRPHF